MTLSPYTLNQWLLLGSAAILVIGGAALLAYAAYAFRRRIVVFLNTAGIKGKTIYNKACPDLIVEE